MDLIEAINTHVEQYGLSDTCLALSGIIGNLLAETTPEDRPRAIAELDQIRDRSMAVADNLYDGITFHVIQ